MGYQTGKTVSGSVHYITFWLRAVRKAFIIRAVNNGQERQFLPDLLINTETSDAGVENHDRLLLHGMNDGTSELNVNSID